jgi:hypothetical protein
LYTGIADKGVYKYHDSVIVVYRFMTDIRKGGRGKQAPYQTQMVRTPVPLLELAQQLTEGYRQVVGTDREQSYLDKVQKAIAEGYYPQEKTQPETIELVEDLQAKHEDMVRKFGECRQQLAEERLKLYDLEEKLETLQKVVTTYEEKAVPNQPRWYYCLRLLNELKIAFK